LQSWNVEIVGEAGTVRTMSGPASAPPSDLSWDGNTDGGLQAADGKYVARLSLTYAQPYEPLTVESTNFLLSTKAPEISLAVAPESLTPLGDKVKEPMRFAISGSGSDLDLAEWNLELYSPQGGSFKSFEGSWPPGAISWDGLSDSGAVVQPSSVYPTLLQVWDEFGNLGSANYQIKVLDIQPAPEKTTLKPRRNGFSPTTTSAKNTIDLQMAFGNAQAAKSWTLSISSGTAGKVRGYSGKAPDLPATVAWDGKDDNGGLVAEGSYFATLSVDYGSTFKPTTVKSAPFANVLTSPKGEVIATPSHIALATLRGGKPLEFLVDAESKAALDSWSLKITDPSGAAFAQYAGAFPANSLKWDGKGSSGAYPDPEATYAIIATVKDEYGNEGILHGSFRIDALPEAPEATQLSAMGRGFSPNNDKNADAMLFSVDVGNRDSADSWKAEIRNSNGSPVKTFSGGASTIPDVLTWDGKSDSGAAVPDGQYYGALTVGYGKIYAMATAKSDVILLVTSKPTVQVLVSPRVFSPDGDGRADTVSIAVNANNGLARMDSWTARIMDPIGNLFASFQVKWPKTEIAWDGRGQDGSLVESAENYSVEVQARDEFGNAAKKAEPIKIDILVEKTPNGYKIKVSSIKFKAYTPDYLDVPADVRAGNLETLSELTKRLGQFPGYQIKIVGHASMIYWDDPVKGKVEQEMILLPLSLARAKAIKAKLVELGIEAKRIDVEGEGALNPVFPDSDLKNRWKNRRVEFFLTK
jgi:flagellar hook assembly protein FlgD